MRKKNREDLGCLVPSNAASAVLKRSTVPGAGDPLEMKLGWGSYRVILGSLSPSPGKEPCSEPSGQCLRSSNFQRLRCCLLLL